MIPVISVVGKRSAGKTKVIEDLLKNFKNRGFSVGTIKHVPREELEVDIEGKDTWRHFEAGADIVVGSSKSELMFRKKTDTDTPLREIVRSFEGLDLVLAEGYKKAETPKILVATDSSDLEMLPEKADILAVVDSKESYSDDEIDRLADVVEDYMLREKIPGLDCGECGYGNCTAIIAAIKAREAKITDCVMLAQSIVSIEINGKEIPLNPFVQNFIKETVLGMISALKGVEGPKNIRINIRQLA